MTPKPSSTNSKAPQVHGPGHPPTLCAFAVSALADLCGGNHRVKTTTAFRPLALAA